VGYPAGPRVADPPEAVLQEVQDIRPCCWDLVLQPKEMEKENT